MYDYLQGKLIEKLPTRIVIEVAGIGYSLLIPLSTYHSLPERGEVIKILTHLNVREDLQQLFGFFTEAERELFRLLITVSGIGPKLALTILSGMEIKDLKRAIIDENLALLTSISGIGRKTAERLIIELREKIVLEERVEKGKIAKEISVNEILFNDSLKALMSLGYNKQHAQEAIKKALASQNKNNVNIEELIRTSLKFI